MTRDEKIVHIAKHYGFVNQCHICIEEMAELTQAISKLERAKTQEEKVACIIHMGEELADVEIMVRQLKYFLGENMTEKEIDQKLDRQLLRIREEKGTC